MQRRAEQAAAKGARGAGRAGPQRLEIGCPVPAIIRCGPLVPRRVGAEAPENGLLNSAVRPIRSCPMAGDLRRLRPHRWMALFRFSSFDSLKPMLQRRGSAPAAPVPARASSGGQQHRSHQRTARVGTSERPQSGQTRRSQP